MNFTILCAILLTSLLEILGDESATSSSKGFLDLFFSPCKCRCGVPNREGRISAGEYLRGYEFPWLALVQHNGTAIPSTLINNKYIITSASLLIGLTPYDIKVTLGQYDRCFPDVSSSNVSVEKILIHPDYSSSNGAHDLALIKLNTPVNIERRVSPICLSIPGRKYTGHVATLVGWSKEENGTSCRPRKTGLPVLEHDTCFGNTAQGLFTEDKGCVGVVGAKSVVCQEDAGGPVMYRSRSGIYELLGVLSDKNDCNNQSGMVMYVKINEHLSWITKMTQDACYCFKS